MCTAAPRQHTHVAGFLRFHVVNIYTFAAHNIINTAHYAEVHTTSIQTDIMSILRNVWTDRTSTLRDIWSDGTSILKDSTSILRDVWSFIR